MTKNQSELTELLESFRKVCDKAITKKNIKIKYMTNDLASFKA